MSTFAPISDIQKSVSVETLNSVVLLRKVAADPDASKALQPATLAKINAIDPATNKPVLDGIVTAVNTVNGPLEAAALETLSTMNAVMGDLENACKLDPVLNAKPIVTETIQQYKDLQQSGATLRIQLRSRDLADKTLVLAQHLYFTIDLIPDRDQAVNTKGNKRPESINKALKTRLAEVADSLARARMMAEGYNVFGAAFEVMSLAENIKQLAPERWNTILKDPALTAKFAQEYVDIQKAISDIPAKQTAILLASAALHQDRQDIAKQPHQIAITINQVNGTFAQQTVTNVQLCAEAAKHLENVAHEEARSYQSIEGWFYQSLRLQTPTTPIKRAVNIGHSPGISPDPLFTSIIPTGSFKKLEADHIVSMKIMTQHPDFQYLTSADKLLILNDVSNFTGLSRRPNASKSDRTYADWNTYLAIDPTTGAVGTGTLAGEIVDQAHMQSLITSENTLRPIIEANIKKLSAQNRASVGKEYPM